MNYFVIYSAKNSYVNLTKDLYVKKKSLSIYHLQINNKSINLKSMRNKCFIYVLDVSAIFYIARKFKLCLKLITKMYKNTILIWYLWIIKKNSLFTCFVLCQWKLNLHIISQLKHFIYKWKINYRENLHFILTKKIM